MTGTASGMKLGDGLGEFMRFTSDAPPADSGFSRSVPDDPGPADEGRAGGPASGAAPPRPIRFTGARSTGRH
jgi:hypothetical protein